LPGRFSACLRMVFEQLKETWRPFLGRKEITSFEDKVRWSSRKC
jgi:hypothetical protein